MIEISEDTSWTHIFLSLRKIILKGFKVLTYVTDITEYHASDLIAFKIDELLIVPLGWVGPEREFESTCECVIKLSSAAHASG